jgi:hypothetical protein
MQTRLAARVQWAGGLPQRLGLVRRLHRTAGTRRDALCVRALGARTPSHRARQRDGTSHGPWTAPQIVEALPWDTAPRYLLRDRDTIYGDHFQQRVGNMGIEDVRIAPRSPWQNPYAERGIGSIWRECLNDIIVLNEDHLRRVLQSLGIGTPNALFVLYDFAVAVPGRRGPKPRKGRRKRKALKDRIDEAIARGKWVEIAWYGGQRKPVCLLSGVCLWYVSGLAPVPIRWVLVVDPSGKSRPEAFFSTDRTMTPQQIVEGFVLRWNVEVTFEESRRHLGVETQRQWSDLAIARTTPVLLGLFSLVCLIAHHLTAAMKLVPSSTAWYLKTEATFSDVLTLVRRTIWAEKYFDKSVIQDDQVIIRRDDWQVIMDQLASTA